jgi:hypothetical protein
MAEFNTENQYSDPEKTAQDTAMNAVHQAGDSPTPSKNPSIDAEKVEKPPANPWMDPQSFPDGGAKAWFTVAGSSACLFVSFGWINCVGIFQAYYQTHQLKQYSPSNIAWIPSLQSKSSPFNRTPFADRDSLLHVVLRTICWQNFRRLRSPLPSCGRHLLPCLRLDDDEHFQKVLPIPSGPSRLLCHWSIDGFLPCIYMCKELIHVRLTRCSFNILGVDMVLCKARRCDGPCCCWIISRRHHSSHNGH